MQKLKYSLLLFASRDRRKYEEYRILLPLPDLRLSEVPVEEPQDLNVEKLVRKKVEVVRNILKDMPFFVEHTALEIDAWKGLPGGLTGVFMRTVGYEGVCKMMQAYEQRTATAKTVIGYYYNNNLQIFVGAATGKIAREPRGKTDYTWDHIFIPDEGPDEKTTYAEMGERKHKISMRKKAAMEFAKYLSHHFESDETDNGVPARKASDVEKKKSNTGKITILFLAANPSDQTRLQTDKEHRIIKSEMERGRHRDFFEFLPSQFAVTITELLRAMNDKPTIVHFSGHGETKGILITTDDNVSQLVPIRALKRLFAPLKDITKIVLLNSCYSVEQAKTISKYGMFVIGMNLPVGDEAAISFAKGFYNGLGEGKTIEAAYNDAMIVLETEYPDHAKMVEVWQNGNKLNL